MTDVELDDREERERDRLAWNLPTPRPLDVYRPPDISWPEPERLGDDEELPQLDPAA